MAAAEKQVGRRFHDIGAAEAGLQAATPPDPGGKLLGYFLDSHALCSWCWQEPPTILEIGTALPHWQ